LHLPGWQDALQALGEHVGRYVDEGGVAAERRGERGGDFRVSDGRGAGQVVGRAVMAGFGERGGAHRGDVTDVHGADRGVADRSVEPAVRGDRCGERQQSLEEQVGPQEGIGDAQVPDVPLDRGVIAQEPHR